MKLVSKGANHTTSPGKVKLFSNVRNELVRLPFFLQYYRERGVEQFYIVDNNSEDGTYDYLREQEDVSLFYTEDSFIANRCGLNWLTSLRNEFGQDSWCLTVDCDELIKYPYCQYIDIPSLCRYLDKFGYQGLFAMMVDCYSNKPINQYSYTQGGDFLNACPYLDSDGYYVTKVDQFPYFGLFGGPRYRAFYEDLGSRQGPTLRKIPLVRWGDGVEYLSVTHSTTPIRLADISGILLHFKYLYQFSDHVKGEVQRNDRQMKDYKQYLSTIEENPGLNFFGSSSVRYRDAEQMLELGLMRSSIFYTDWALEALMDDEVITNEQRQELRIKAKLQLGIGTIRKNLNFSNFMNMWPTSPQFESTRKVFSVSVVIPVFNAERLLARSIESAINQPEVSEILLIDDGSTDASLGVCNAYAERHHWIKVYQHPGGENLGAGETRNLGIAKATCEFIAFLDADDYFLPGRFRHQGAVLLADPSIDGVYGAQNFEFATPELEAQRLDAGLSLLTSLKREVEPDKLFLDMNPIGKQGNFHCNALTVRRSIFDRVGLFWDLRTEDVQMWLKMTYAAKLVGVSLRTPVSTKFVHSGNRMNPKTTRKYRPLVIKSIIEFASKRKDDYEKLNKLLQRYFNVLKSCKYSDAEVVVDADIQGDLLEVIEILGARIVRYRHSLEKIGRQTEMFSPSELNLLIKEGLNRRLDDIINEVSKSDIEDYTLVKPHVEEYVAILSATFSVVDSSDELVSDRLQGIVSALRVKIQKYSFLLKKLGDKSGLYSDDVVDTAINALSSK